MMLSRFEACKDAKENSELAGKVIEGLRDEALHIAKNIDPEDLAKENGTIRLIAEIEKTALPRRKE